ncbi:family 43 glycosylhydrolase [Pirellulaceae bacterium SH449]
MKISFRWGFGHQLFWLVLFLLCECSRVKGQNFDAPGAFNPIVPGYFADPTIKKFGDHYYLYSTTDGNGGGRAPSQVWVSRDFHNWTLVPMNWPTAEQFYWAPDVVERDGQYYLYYSQPCVIYAAVGDSPVGPWRPLNDKEGEIIPNHLVDKVITLDAQTFEDKDGSTYVYWGTWGIYPDHGCGVAKLGKDMQSILNPKKIPNTQIKDFFEAPFLFERNGTYYLTYSSGSCHDSTYRVQYATSDRPDGDFTMGKNNPVLSTNGDGTIDGPGHHSLLKNGDEYLIVYHRHDIPRTPNGLLRQLCADRMTFDNEGSIEQVVPTHSGIGPLSANVETSVNLAFTRPVKTHSHYVDDLRKHEYKPEYAVDDNNGTLWRPADNKMGHSLTIDLESSQTVRRIVTQFEYATWYYQYLLETSIDGVEWQVFADKRENQRWGSPMIDRNEHQARFVRLTITGVEKPGIFGAVWNIKVFAEDRVDPLETLASEGFSSFMGSQASSLNRVPYQTRYDSKTEALIHIDAADLELGSQIKIIDNQGSLSGQFVALGQPPTVAEIAGRKGIKFNGKEVLKASFLTPSQWSGNSSYTIEMVVLNPEIDEAEAILSWCGRGGPDGMTGQVGYGSHPTWGAVGHWGFADMGFRNGPPRANQWHHIAIVFDGILERVYVNGELNNQSAKMLLMHKGRDIFVGASEPGIEHFSGYLSLLKVYNAARSSDIIQSNARKLALEP